MFKFVKVNRRGYSEIETKQKNEQDDGGVAPR